MKMSRALTATQKRRIGKLFEKYFDDWMVGPRWKEGNIF